MRLQTEINTEFQRVTPFARKLLLAFACVVSVYVLIVFVIDGSLNLMFGVALSGIGLFSMYMYTKPERRYYTPVVLTIFYFFGYLLSLTVLLLNRGDNAVSGFGAIGKFGFTNEEFAPVMITIAIGMAGIMVIAFLAEKINSRLDRVNYKSSKDSETLVYDAKYILTFKVYVWVWFVISLALILIMWWLKIGRTGLIHETTLPFKLAGILVYTRKYIIPFVGIFLFGFFLNANNKRQTVLSLMLISTIGAIGSIAGLSRAYFVFICFPTILILFFTSTKHSWKRTLFYVFSVVDIILLVVLVKIIEQLRNIGYSGGSISPPAVYQLLLSDIDFNIFKMIPSFLSLALSRIEGMRELLAASNSQISDLYATWAIFISDTDYLNDLILSVFGFTLDNSGTKAYGISFSLFGMLRLSGSYIVVFVGTALSCLFPIFAEELFIRKQAYAVSCFIAVNLGMQTWSGLYFFDLSRSIIMILGCYFLMNILLIPNLLQKLRNCLRFKQIGH